MILYGSYTSPYVRHCRIVLNDSGCQWSFQEVDYAGSAKQSPTKKVPFLKDQQLTLTDSSSILKYLREKFSGQWFADINDYDLFCMVNTLLDSAVNLFLLEKDGLTPDSSRYLNRQSERVNTGLELLNERLSPCQSPLSDGQIRAACFLGWGVFRNRFSLENHSQLQAFLDSANQWPAFEQTAPPQVA